MASDTDSIRKQILLKAPRARVWRAVSTASEFGAWFRCKFDGEFAPGAVVQGRITLPGYEHYAFEFRVERMEPERLFAYRWRATAGDQLGEPERPVEMHLEEQAGGTLLTIVESGFATLPPTQREAAFRRNEGGWTGQLGNIERHVA
jgi:uncharacterized protein YndB with AHSA1/START domain